MSKALVVLSGGQDSTTCLYAALATGYEEVRAITFNYGQRHRREIEAAKFIAKLAEVPHEVIDLGEHILSSTSPLTDPNAELEQYSDFKAMDEIIGDRIEKTFVPMRNALFLTIAANRAVEHGATSIYTGVSQADNANYPDCRELFIDSMAFAINEALGIKSLNNRVYIKTPLIHLSKASSVKYALGFEGCYLALAYSHTAYDGTYPPSGKDHATILRAHGFEMAGVPDPLIVRAYYSGEIDALPSTGNYLRWREALHPRYEERGEVADIILNLEDILRTAMKDGSL